jgi:glycosyltransferase involved in cell wall biosynthesis
MDHRATSIGRRDHVKSVRERYFPPAADIQNGRGIRVLYLTDNPNLGSTARILQNWLLLGREKRIEGIVGARQDGAFVTWLRDNSIDYQINPMPWLDRQRPWTSLLQAWKLARWARKRGIQIIHCNEHNVYPFALVLRRFLNRPLVCHVRFALERKFCEWAFEGRGRQPDALLWTSRQQAEDCSEAVAGIIPPENQHLVYLGVNLNRFGLLSLQREKNRRGWGFEPDEIVLGTASAMKPIKRLEEYVELVARIASRHPRVVGVIAGDAPAGRNAYREQLLEQIRKTGLGRRFRWLGNLEDIEPFHHAVDIFVSTSDYETFGNSVCEAMACRRPVVAYQGGSVHEVLGDAGIVLQTGDLEGAVQAVEKLVLDPNFRRELGNKARNRVANSFNPARSFEQLIGVYEGLLAPSSLEGQ